MKRTVLISGLIGLLAPIVVFILDQIVPTKLWYMFWPAGYLETTLDLAMHSPREGITRVIFPLVGFGGNFVIYALAGGGITALARQCTRR
jgi:hypothetical protein